MTSSSKSIDQTTPRIKSLDAIRGIAATVVVIHHCLLVFPRFSDYFFGWIKSGKEVHAQNMVETVFFESPLRLIWGGFEAVTLFYVLSGFVLALPWVAGRPPTYNAYAIRRFCRLYFPYITIILIAAALSALLHITTAYPGVSYWVTQWNWAKPVTSWSLIDHAFMIGQTNDLNGVVHSLIWEMRVSLIFPIYMLFMYRWRLWGAVACFILTGVLVAGLTLLSHRLSPGPATEVMYEVQKTLFYGHHFVIGALLAFNQDAIKNFMARLPKISPILLLLAGLYVMQVRWSTNPAVQAALVGIGSAAVICAALTSVSIDKVLKIPFLQWLGEISYSLYLVHVPIIFTAIILLHDFVPLWAILLGVPPISLLAGWLFHITVAVPSVRLGRYLTRTPSK